MGALCVFFIALQKKQSEKNIDRVFQSSLAPSEKKRLCMAYYSHIITSIKEIILYALVSKKYLERHIEIIGLEYLQSAINKGNGTLVLTGHFGNWEFAPLFFLINLTAKITFFIVCAKTYGSPFWILFFYVDSNAADSR